MRIRILAADSMGVRSLSVVVETEEGVIGIDLGASIAPRRYGLPPHPIELERLEYSLSIIRDWIAQSDIVTISHYHYDHYMREEPDLYRGKILIVKHPKRDINRSQAIRSYILLKKNRVEEIARQLLYGDNQTFEFGKLKIIVSPPVWHGYPGSRVGRVIMFNIICCDESVIYASDVQGPADPEAVRTIIEWSKIIKPKVLIVGGPPTYFAGFKVPVKHVEAGLEGSLKLIEEVKPEILVLDHHLLRDLNYKEKIQEHTARAKDSGVKLVTAAEFMGRENEQLEALRRHLWKENPL